MSHIRDYLIYCIDFIIQTTFKLIPNHPPTPQFVHSWQMNLHTLQTSKGSPHKYDYWTPTTPPIIPKCFNVKAVLNFWEGFISFCHQNIDLQDVWIFPVFQFEYPLHFKPPTHLNSILVQIVKSVQNIRWSLSEIYVIILLANKKIKKPYWL